MDDESRDASATITPRTDWRLGGRTVQSWRGLSLAWACLSVAVGVTASFVIAQLWPSPSGTFAAGLVLWVLMAVPIIVGFRASRPAGLLRFRAVDILYGVVFGVVLRVLQGLTIAASGTDAGFPSFADADGTLPPLWWITDAVWPVLVVPATAELFFRGVVLVALYTVLRRPLGKLLAAVVTGVASTGLFLIVQIAAGADTVSALVTLGALGVTCAALVLLTGRIWPALLVHGVFAATQLVLGLAGTFVL